MPVRFPAGVGGAGPGAAAAVAGGRPHPGRGGVAANAGVRPSDFGLMSDMPLSIRKPVLRAGPISGCCSTRPMTCSALLFRIERIDVRDQRQEELEPGSVGGSGVELESSGKQCCSIKALKAFCLAFSRLSCSVSFSIFSISLPSCYGFAGLRLHPQLVLHLALLVVQHQLLVVQHALLVAWIASPVERR